MICKNDIANLKTDILEKVGQKIIVKGSLGRSKSFEKEATIEKAYTNIFIVKYEENKRSVSYQYKDVLTRTVEVDVFDGEDFPGYDKVKLSYWQLHTIINAHKKDWVAALQNQKAVYLITDTNNGKLYVGSATSDNGMLLSRWNNYISNGHGGNKGLIELIEKEGFEYVKKHFQYSILENYNAKIDDKIVLSRESHWKEVLHSREFGYNQKNKFRLAIIQFKGL